MTFLDPFRDTRVVTNPMIVVKDLREAQPFPPTVTFEIGNGFEVRHRPQAKPCDRADLRRNAQEVAQDLLPVEGDPSHTEALSGRREPKVLNREAH